MLFEIRISRSVKGSLICDLPAFFFGIGHDVCELRILWVALFYYSLIMCTASIAHCQKFTCLWIIFIAKTSVADGPLKYLI